MTPEERRLLQETHDIAVENAEILRGIRRTTRWSAFFKVMYWLIVIGLSVGAFWFIQPYVNTLKGSLKDFTGSDNSSLFMQ